DANLAQIDWQSRLGGPSGEEIQAQNPADEDGRPKTTEERDREWEGAVRAYRQLALELRKHGVNDIADIFAYRAQRCQRTLLRRQRRFGRYVGSGLLDLLAGYGFRPGKTLVVYLVVILGYAAAYFALQNDVITSPVAALIFSITSFHGRGFSPGGLALDAPTTIFAASEAIIGLVIEVSFIATFTQRFFTR